MVDRPNDSFLELWGYPPPTGDVDFDAFGANLTPTCIQRSPFSRRFLARARGGAERRAPPADRPANRPTREQRPLELGRSGRTLGAEPPTRGTAHGRVLALTFGPDFMHWRRSGELRGRLVIYYPVSQ
jgi:hypothetical protein